jgi:segregation and condensation protein A
MPADHPSPASPAAPPAGDDGDAQLHLGYAVAIDNFSGPLDLLLFLVRRTELDIIDIPILLIIDQFVEAVGRWTDPDLETAGDFILMAATLLEIKARAIAPPRDDEELAGADDEIFDPRSTLISSLLRYRRFKEAARLLELLGEARAPCLVRQLHEIVPDEAPDESDLDLSMVDAHLLLRTYEAILLRLNGLGPRTVLVDDIPMSVRIERLVDALREHAQASLAALLGPAPSRMTQVAMVLAVLEGTRQGLVAVGQEHQYGEISLRLREADEPVATLPPATAEEEPKRRRRLPLLTYLAPHQADDGGEPPPEEEAESDEQRFLRELEEASQVDALLAGVSDLEAAFAAYCARHHPELVARPPVDAARLAPAGTAGNVPEAAPSPVAPAAAAAPEAAPRPADPAAAPMPAAVPAVVGATTTGGALPSGAERQPVADATEAAEAAEAAAVPSAVPAAGSPAGHGLATDRADPGAAQLDQAPAAGESVPSADGDAGAVAGAAVAGLDADQAAGAATDAAPARDPSGAGQAAPAPAAEQAPPTAAVAEPAGAALPGDAPSAGSGRGLSAPAPPSAPEHPVIDAQAWPADRLLEAAGDGAPRPADSDEEPTSDPDRSPPPPAPGALLVGSAVLEAPALAASPIGMRSADPSLAAGDQDRAPAGEPAGVAGAISTVLPTAADGQPPGDAAPASVPSVPATPIPAVAEVADAVLPPPGRPSATPTSDPTTAAAAVVPGDAAPADDRMADPPAPEAPAMAVMPLLSAHARASAPADLEDAATDAAAAPVAALATVDEHRHAALPSDPPPGASVSLPPPAQGPTLAATQEPAAPQPRAEHPALEQPAALRLPAPAPDPDPDPEPLGGPPPRSHRPPSSSATATAPPTPPRARSAMPPPPQRRTRIIAALVAMNCAWLAFAWLSWVPRDLLEVVAMPPALVEGRMPLRFTFNLDMVAAATLDRPPAVVPEITPAVPGSWSWRDARTLEFAPREDLPAASAFNILLAKDALRAESGLRLGHDVRLAIRTASLRLQAARVETFAPDGRAIVVLDFNQSVDPLLIARTLTIAAPGDAALPASPAPPAATALDAAPSARIRLQLEGGGRFELAAAELALPSGTCGIAGPLGLAAPWRARMELGHVLAVRSLSVDAPPRGDITLHLATTAVDVPMGVLEAALSVQPPVAYAVHATAQGLDLVGAFQAGTAYRIAVAERWPEASPLHPLAAYPAGGSWRLAIPERRAGLWLDGASQDGRIPLGAQAVDQAGVEVLPRGDEQPLLTSTVALLIADDASQWSAALDADQLTAALPSGRYRLRVRAGGDPQALAETDLTIEEIPLRPRDLAAAVVRWWAQGIGGDGGADVSVRRLRVGR